MIEFFDAGSIKMLPEVKRKTQKERQCFWKINCWTSLIFISVLIILAIPLFLQSNYTQNHFLAPCLEKKDFSMEEFHRVVTQYTLLAKATKDLTQFIETQNDGSSLIKTAINNVNSEMNNFKYRKPSWKSALTIQKCVIDAIAEKATVFNHRAILAMFGTFIVLIVAMLIRHILLVKYSETSGGKSLVVNVFWCLIALTLAGYYFSRIYYHFYLYDLLFGDYWNVS